VLLQRRARQYELCCCGRAENELVLTTLIQIARAPSLLLLTMSAAPVSPAFET
jgi:hypothetical protein